MSVNRPPSRRLGFAALAAVVFLLIVPGATLAHAELESSSPGVGATVTGPLEQIVLSFTEELRSDSFFRVEAGGQQVARGRVDGARTMVAQTGSLGPGEYTVNWRSVATDGHPERGSFKFTIAAATAPPATPTPSAPPSATPSAAPSATPAASPSPSPSPSVSLVPVPTAPPQQPVNATAGDMAVPIIATLVVIGGLGLWLLRRQRRV